MVNMVIETTRDILKPSNGVEIGLIGAISNKWEASAKTKKNSNFGFLKHLSKKGEKNISKVSSWVNFFVEPKGTSLSLPNKFVNQSI